MLACTLNRGCSGSSRSLSLGALSRRCGVLQHQQQQQTKQTVPALGKCHASSRAWTGISGGLATTNSNIATTSSSSSSNITYIRSLTTMRAVCTHNTLPLPDVCNIRSGLLLRHSGTSVTPLWSLSARNYCADSGTQRSKPNQSNSSQQQQQQQLLGSQHPDSKGEEQQAPEKLLFRAKYIVALRIIMRTKLVAIAVACSILGRGLLGYHVSTVTWIAVIGVSAIAMLSARFASMIILRLSYYEDEGVLRVSTMNMWGRRIDYLVDAQHVVPFVETSAQHPSALLHKLEIYDSREPRFYSVKYSDVKEPALLAELLWLPPELGGKADRSWNRAQRSADDAVQKDADSRRQRDTDSKQ
eukprot:scpid101356/ scgid30104/ 